jgi:hypothetical protein
VVAIQPAWGGSVEGGAAALFLESPQSSLLISTTSFVSNQLQAGSYDLRIDNVIGGYAYGGALSISAHFVCTISNSTFRLNSAAGGMGSAQSGRVMGGAVAFRAVSFLSSSSAINDHGISIFDSRFSENTVAASPSPTVVAGGSSAGGAVAVLLRSSANSHNISIRSSIFESNSVAGIVSQDASGGAVSVVQESRSPTMILFETSSFVTNRVSFLRTQSDSDHMVLGGAVAIFSSRSLIPGLFFRNSRFFKNEAMGEACQRFGACMGARAAGGAISFFRQSFSQAQAPDVSIESCEFVSNRAFSRTGANQQHKAAHGGAMFFSSQSSGPNVRSTTFIDNSVECRGIALETATSSNPDDKFCDSGAAAFRSGATITGCLFQNNSVVTYSKFGDLESPSHQSAGGALTAQSQLTVVNTTFVSNWIRALECHGGAIATTAPELSFTGVKFMHNRLECSSQSSSGGAMDVTVSPARAIFREIYFGNNSIFNFNDFLNVGIGGSLHAVVNRYWNFSDVVFERSLAGQGGALSLIFDATLPAFDNVKILNCSASDRGGGVVSRASTVMELAVARFLNDSRTFLFKNNTAPFAPDQSSASYRLQLLQPPPSKVWPGQEFSMRVALLDILNQTILDPKISIQISAVTTAVHWRWKPWRDALENAGTKGLARDSGVFVFPALEVTIPPDTMIRFSFTIVKMDDVASPQPAALLAPPMAVTSCPPGYVRSDSPEAIICKKCPLFTYSLDGNSTCNSCPAAESHASPQHTAADLCMEERSIDSNLGREENQDSQLTWTISKGYFPEPSFLQPEKLLRCPNVEACLQYNCTVRHSKLALGCEQYSQSFQILKHTDEP